MRYGFVLPGGTAVEQLEQAELAERAGWDGVFAWEAAFGVDPWALLAAAAARTSRVLLGTLLTPLPWRRPWKVASQLATLDQLSGGRAILTVGLGAVDTDLPDTGEVLDLRGRAELLDEGIDLVRTLLDGGTAFVGRHYRYEGGRRPDLVASVGPASGRHVPIWVVGAWPRPRSMQRALRCDGLVPQYAGEPTPEAAAAVRSWMVEHGAGSADLVGEGETPADDPLAAAAAVLPWAEAGCTWWIESRWSTAAGQGVRVAEATARIAAGPPRST